MKNLLGILAIGFGSAICVGVLCIAAIRPPSNEPSAVQVTPAAEKLAVWVPTHYLPKDATNIEDLGNGWVTYQLRVPGFALATFMFKHVQYDQRNPGGDVTTVEYEVNTKL